MTLYFCASATGVRVAVQSWGKIGCAVWLRTLVAPHEYRMPNADGADRLLTFLDEYQLRVLHEDSLLHMVQMYS